MAPQIRSNWRRFDQWHCTGQVSLRQWFPHLDTPVCLYSVDEAGGRRLVATLAPGASTMRYFYIGSGWLVTDEEDTASVATTHPR